MSKTVNLIHSNKKAHISYTRAGEEEILEVPIVTDEDSGEELVTHADILKAEQHRISKKYNLSTYNMFELLTLWAPVKSRINGIKQKFRFNKILFYIGKRIEKEYTSDGLEFDEMNACRSGPIPKHLKDDIIALEQQKLVNVHIERDQKKIPNSQQNWQKMMTPQGGSCVVKLTPMGEKTAKNLWADVEIEFGDELLKIIQKTKEQLLFLDTNALREKVHKDYPEMKKDYIEDDNENDYQTEVKGTICP
jgi:hypothetical protein